MNTGQGRQDHITAGLYFDYCTGLSIDEVAAKHRRTPGSVRARFNRHGLPLRKKVCSHIHRNPHRMTGVPFGEANREKARIAAAKKLPQYKAALAAVSNPRMKSVLALRIEHPEMSFWELGELHEPRLSKDTVSALLRRAVERVAS